MATKTNDLSKLLPAAQEMMEKLALTEAEKKLLLDKTTKPSGVSDQEAMKRVAAIQRAVSNGLTEGSGLWLNQRCLRSAG